ncbi:unnamed protein product [Mytilus edulis]|uniref:Core-binding (CB) domain-containing protein n=1 Tax=Mytilus edulis TaxID=6550 RepID=A0A8S3UGX9_MYTED|nr:unnamed protein product [Mytilus edulis]
MRPLQLYLLAWWRPALHSLNHLIPLYQPLQEHLFWWLNRRNFFKGVILVILVKHINWLELKAVQLALQTFLIKVQFKSVLVRTDNATVVSYLNKQGGTRSPDLVTWHGIFEMVYKSQCPYSGKKKNIIADALSRGKMTIRLTEWALNMTKSEFVVPSARNTSNRSVCDFNEQEAASVLLSLAGRNSSVNRCTVNEMDKSICLCIPATDHSKQSITKNTERGLCNFTDSANVAETVVVQSTSQPVNRLSNTTACTTKSIKSKWNFSSKSKCSKSCSLESVKRSYTAKGFSPKIASIISNARKQSTQTVYNARLKLFDSWCQERSINPSTATVPEIAEFLMFLHTVKNCKPSTLAGYKSAIALIHSSKDRISINMDLRNLIKGLYNINSPIRQLASNWDLPLVLLVLTKTPLNH